MRKLIKVAPEDKLKLLEVLLRGAGRVGYFSRYDLYDINESNLEYLRAEGIPFEIIEPEEWRWQDGRPTERIAS